ncbi:unnamed protein product [Ostreobium quekettii]|uniref:Uncharacterized protein n=1 Tax=Ostreobium quekettii TaxID=121088 RepID=A0A8S1JDB7_9CHLO|nr:unnamed protein product [Ostreobium quekettii]|eukprot:evm.model.scf_2753.2 EVM.evm.TU.scf_2753.2   scf_2753:1246-3329(+)
MGGPFPGLRHLSLRHPPLQNDAAVATLLAHGNGLTWAQAAPVVVDLFVRPSLTLAVCGCFRRELLRLVVSLGELGGSEGRQGRSLSTVAVGVALLRAVEAAPRIRRVVLQHFLETPCPLDSISGGVLPDGLTDLEVARACLRGVRAVPELGQCWGPSWFVRLLKHEVADVRWCCVEAISHIRQLTDYNRERLAHLVLTEEETLGCLLR